MKDFYNKYKLNGREKFIVFLIIYHWIWMPALFIGVSIASIPGDNIFFYFSIFLCLMTFICYVYSIYIVNTLSFIFIIYCLLKRKIRKTVSYAWFISMIIFMLYGYRYYIKTLTAMMWI